MSKRSALLALLPLAVACSDGESTDAGVSTPDAGPTSYDATVVVDAGFRYDSGISGDVDGGFAPGTLMEDYISLAGVNTYVHVRGTQTSTMPPVVVLNTGPMLGHEYQVAPLEFLLGPGGAADPDRMLVFYDMRATGRSGFGSIESSTVTIDAHVEDFGNLLTWLDGFADRTGPVDVLAHGYGTAVATLYAAAHPERISRMVYVTPYPSHVLEQADWGAEWNRRLSSGDRERLAEITMWHYCFRDFPRCSRDVWNIIGPTWLCPENRAVYDEMVFEYVDIRPFTYFTVKDLRDRQFDHRPVMAQVSAPVSVISGPCDPIPATAAENYAAHLQNATHQIIDGAGHFPMTETATVFRQAVKRALTY